LNHFVLHGDTSGGAVWADLDKLLGGISFAPSTGARCRCPPARLTRVTTRATSPRSARRKRKKSRNVIAIKGVGGFDKPIIRKGNTLRGMTTLYLVGVDGVKAAIHRRLSMQESRPASYTCRTFSTRNILKGSPSRR